MHVEGTSRSVPIVAVAGTAAGENCAVVLVQPESMNLLGLMLESILRRRLEEPRARRHARAIRGDVTLEASGMGVTLKFEPGLIEISRRISAHPRVQIHGTLAALLRAAIGVRLIRNFLTRKLRVRGNPITLWRVLALVRT